LSKDEKEQPAIIRKPGNLLRWNGEVSSEESNSSEEQCVTAITISAPAYYVCSEHPLSKIPGKRMFYDAFLGCTINLRRICHHEEIFELSL
jgi:hypothetical protein